MSILKFEVDEREADIIVASLGKQPYELVADLIMKLRMQAGPQLAKESKNEDKEFHKEGD